MDENVNPLDEQQYVENPDEGIIPDEGAKFTVGFFVLLAGGIWALVELIISVLYFFN